MEIDLTQLIADITGSGAIILVLVLVLKPFVERLMDNLDKQTKSYMEMGHQIQGLATSLQVHDQNQLMRTTDVSEVVTTLIGKISEQESCQRQIIEGISDTAQIIERLQKAQEIHEERAQARHDQSIQDAHERQIEIVKALKSLNGKS